MDTSKTGKRRMMDDDVRGLQTRIAAVSDEFAAEHAEVRVGLGAVSDVAIEKIGGISGVWNVSLAAWQPINRRPCSMEVRRICLPGGDIGGFLSVPDCVRSPVV